jgi:hypothetical protein
MKEPEGFPQRRKNVRVGNNNSYKDQKAKNRINKSLWTNPNIREL